MCQLPHDRLQKRSAALREAARALFCEQGYERTTLADVVERAGGSLATLYKLFGNKEGLLEAVIDDFRDRGSQEIRAIAQQSLPPRETLMQIGTIMHEQAIEADHIAIARILISHTLANPEFSCRFFQSTQIGKHEALLRLFEKWASEGIAMSGSPEMLSNLFFGMVLLDFHLQAMSNGQFECANKTTLANRIEFFLRGAGLD